MSFTVVKIEWTQSSKCTEIQDEASSSIFLVNVNVNVLISGMPVRHRFTMAAVRTKAASKGLIYISVGKPENKSSLFFPYTVHRSRPATVN